MKKWLNGIKIIVLIILIIGFVAYSYITKNENDNKNKKEGFQTTDNDYHYPHFDVSANYFTLSQEEQTGGFIQTEDSTILNVGDINGVIDITTIPWDSENLTLDPKDVLWGIVSREASADLYNKVYVAQQLQALQLADDNKYYYNSIMLHYGTSDPNIGNGMQVADFIVNFSAPLLLPMVAEKLLHLAGIEEESTTNLDAEASLFKKTTTKSVQPLTAKETSDLLETSIEKRQLMKMKLRQLKRVSSSPKFAFDKEGKPNFPIKAAEALFKKLATFIGKTALKGVAKIFSIIFNWIELIQDVLVKSIMNLIYMSIIMPIIMSMSMPLIAPRSGPVVYVQNEIDGVVVSLVAMAVTAGTTTVMAGIAEASHDPLSTGVANALFIATMGAALAGALASYYEQQAAVANGYLSIMQGMMQQTGHGAGDGVCPAGYVALNEILNPTTEIFISFCPIFGDLIDLMYPYMCVRDNYMITNDRAQNFMEQLICIRDPYIQPNWMNYNWISSIFIDWPDYNGKYSTGAAVSQSGAQFIAPTPVGGKMRIVPTQSSEAGAVILDIIGGAISDTALAATGNNIQIKTQPYYSWVNYTNFNDVANYSSSYYNLDIDLDGFNQNLTFQYIGGHSSADNPGPDPLFKFFYMDFTEPSILMEMAQYYYNYAIRKPFPNSDGTFTVQYISKINYVVASSLYTCDAMCEMINVTYNPINGQTVNEATSFDSDRRFYFRWRPDPTKVNPINPNASVACAPLTPIWGMDKNNATWVYLDDAYDEAKYALNDALHFPTDPTQDGTGLVDSDLLICAYELYLENKARSDYDATSIYAQYTATPALQIQFSSLVTAYTNLQTAISAMGAAYLTTGQLAGVQTLSSTQTAYVSAINNYNNALSTAQPFYLDLIINTNTSKQNYLDVLGQIYTNNENPVLFLADDLDFNTSPIINDLQSLMDAVINARTNVWNQHQLDRPILFNNDIQYNIPSPNATTAEIQYHNTKYFDVTGCTWIDGAAQEARTPDVTNDETDIRFPVQLDVTLNLKRCPYINITTDTCIDLSNVEHVIDAFNIQHPDKIIKSIHNIQAKGNNICQFIWDEYSTENPSVVSRTTNRILYQQDLSGCTFCLPQDTTSNYKLFVDNNTTYTTSIQTVPITTPITIFNYKNPALYPPLVPPTVTTIPNLSTSLNFVPASYWLPLTIDPINGPESFTFTTTSDTMPRYDPVTYLQLPDLIRPKKPIRIIYPDGTESNLGNQISNYCGDPANMSNFILKYNKNTSNLNKILNIQRAFTTSATTCDYEVDILLQTPTKLDGTPYLQHMISNINKISQDGTTTTISMYVAPSNYFTNSMINVAFNSGSESIVYTNIDTRPDPDDGSTNPPLSNIGENWSAYNNSNTYIKGVFQGIQGLRTIASVNMTNNQITYNNDISRFPDNIDTTTINGGTKIFGNYTPNSISNTYSNTGMTTLAFTVARSTISGVMTSNPINGSLTEPFSNTSFTYQSLETNSPTMGLAINKHTSTLNGAYSNTGFNFSKPINDNTNSLFGSDISYFNNNLVSNYVNAVSNLRDTSKSYLANIYTQLNLSNIAITGGSNDGQKCSDPAIIQRIVDSYNNFSTPTGLLNQQLNTVVQVVQASTDYDIINNSNECHMIFENKNEVFGDYYYADKYNSNNYTATNTLVFQRFPMIYAANLTNNGKAGSFKPDITSINFNSTLQADDLALSLGYNLNPYAKSLRASVGNNNYSQICQIDGGNKTNTALYTLFVTDYTKSKVSGGTGNVIMSNIKYMNIGFDRTDYLVNQTMSGLSNSITTTNIIRVQYTLQPFDPNNPNNCSWTYTPGSYKVQMVSPSTDVTSNFPYSYVQFIGTTPTSITISDNISPLFMDSEYSGAEPSDVNTSF